MGITQLSIGLINNSYFIQYKGIDNRMIELANPSSTILNLINTLFEELALLPTPEQQAYYTLLSEKEVVIQAANKYKQFLLETDLTPEQMLELIDIYPDWITATAYVINDVVKHNGKLYKVIQAHTSQLDWTPDIVPALFVEIVPPEIIAEWEQRPAENPYNIGDKVIFEGQVYESIANTNTWSPATYPAGWQLV